MTLPAAPTPETSAEDRRAHLRAKVLAAPSQARFFHWGMRDYGAVLALQESLREARRSGGITDTWLAGEHPTVITQGVRGHSGDLTVPSASIAGIPIFKIDRGGMTTLHNPGQLVIYPIVRTQPGLLAQARVSRALLETVRDWIAERTGVHAAIERGRPGLFVEGRKLAAIGLSIHGGVSMHGIAVNLANDLSPWQWIIPCGEPGTQPVTLAELTGRPQSSAEFIADLPRWLASSWGYDAVHPLAAEAELLPSLRA